MNPPNDFGREAREKQERELQKNKRMKKTIIRIAMLLVTITAVIFFWTDIKAVVASSSSSKGKKSKTKVQQEIAVAEISPGISIVKKWDMPKVLTEISGLSYLDDQRFACVQDEVGSIYIYNIATSTLEKEIKFSAPGDYEGLALVNGTAWVLRADGKLFEVNITDQDKPVVKEYSTHLTAEQNCEGLCYDKANNRLLVAIKDAEPGNPAYKGIYAFDLGNKTMAAAPVFRINLDDKVFANNSSKKGKSGSIMPSSIAINPLSNDMYITDGRKSKLLVLSQDGSVKKLYQLDTRDFAQPEGITFTPAGELYISNEGPKAPGNILRVEQVSE